MEREAFQAALSFVLVHMSLLGISKEELKGFCKCVLCYTAGGGKCLKKQLAFIPETKKLNRGRNVPLLTLNMELKRRTRGGN